jgi:hypothetical protein
MFANLDFNDKVTEFISQVILKQPSAPSAPKRTSQFLALFIDMSAPCPCWVLSNNFKSDVIGVVMFVAFSFSLALNARTLSEDDRRRSMLFWA